jgi:long-subunit acyl-CoA synthetase (AMP-forming)
VKLPHRAVVAAVAGLDCFLDACRVPLGPADSLLSFLPLAHIYERSVSAAA